MVTSARTIERALTADDYLQAAIGIAKNIKQYEVRTAHGLYWNAPAPDHLPEIRLDHYNGASGIALFLAQLYEATGDAAYAEQAGAAGEYILYQIQQHHSALATFDIPGSIYWEATAGQDSYVAVDLLELARILQKPEFAQAAEAIAEENVATVQKVANGFEWSGYAEIIQDEGAALFLLRAAERFGHPEWRTIAIGVGEAILASEVPLGEGQARYPGHLQLLDRSYQGQWRDRFYPGFTHGVAGTAYFFAKLYEQTDDKRFLDAAKKSARFIESIAHPFGDGKLIPLFQPASPTEAPIYYVGYCHGPEGQSRLFYELYRVTQDQHYLDFYQQLIAGLIGIGVPEVHSTGYWNNFSICCGLASVLRTFATAWGVTKDSQYHEYAKRTAAVILGQGNVDEHGVYRWYQAWERTTLGDIQNIISLKAGDAGLGQIFLEYWSMLRNEHRFHIIRRPEDPFPDFD